jgi:hypothetical protein
VATGSWGLGDAGELDKAQCAFGPATLLDEV